MKLLVVEDEPRIASFLLKGLKSHGYAVEHARTGRDALALARDSNVAMVILDLGLPDVDGSEVLLRLRERGDEVPVIVLTARSDVAARVDNLDLGADDYLTKPFAFEELLARVRARLRTRAQRSAVLHAGDLELDLRTRQARVAGKHVELTAREFSLLETLLRHPRQVLSREQLASRVWGLSFDTSSNVVDVYIRYLRRKLGKHRIETIRGAGYRLADTA